MVKRLLVLFVLIGILIIGCSVPESKLDSSQDVILTNKIDTKSINEEEKKYAEVSNISQCIKEWEQNPPSYDIFYIDFKENVTELEVKELLTSHNLDIGQIRFPENFSIDIYYILTTDGSFNEFINFLNSQQGVEKAFESSMIGADYKPYILDFSGNEKIIRLTTKKGINLDEFIYNFTNITIKQIKQDKIIWGYINPKGKDDSKIICSLKEDPRVLSVRADIIGHAGTT